MNLMEKYLLKIKPEKIDINEKLSDLTEEEMESYQERASIIEYCGNMSRGKAERLALERIMRKRKHLLN